MKIILKEGFQGLSGLHKGVVLLKNLSKPLMPKSMREMGRGEQYLQRSK